MSPAEACSLAVTVNATTHANCIDPVALTAPARAARWAQYERQVDPEGVLDPAERTRRAEHARRAFMAGLSLAAAQARARRKAEREDAQKREPRPEAAR
jgi:hypothetical protein